MVGACCQRGGCRGAARGIAERHGQIAQPAFMTDAPDRRALGAGQEGRFIPGEELDQRCVGKPSAGPKVRLRGQLGKAVPGAGQLAVVAAVDAVADERAQGFRDAAVVFDGEIGDAAAGVEPVGRHDGPGGAGRETGAAAAAVVDPRRVWGQDELRVDDPEKKPGAGLPVDQVGVLADPAESRALRERLLQYRGRVDEDPVAEGADGRGDALGQLLQPAAQDLVIVPPQGIARDEGVGRVRQGRRHGRGRLRQIVEARRDHRAGAGDQFGGAGAARAMAGHIVHVAVVAECQPVGQMGLGGAQVRIRDADLLQAQFPAPVLDRRGQRGTVLACGGRLSHRGRRPPPARLMHLR